MQWPLDEAFPLRAVLCADPDEARVADRKGEKAQGSVDRSQKRSADRPVSNLTSRKHLRTPMVRQLICLLDDQAERKTLLYSIVNLQSGRSVYFFHRP